ncbi:MAG: hypothetical protein VYD81_01415, partial [Planctomycetota bacterium]|nr:hypothetical protein [Planctomycetota bacterium]
MNPVAALRLTLLVSFLVSTAGCTDRKLSSRALHFDYLALISGIPEGAKKVDIWIPVPRDDETQRISNLKIKAPGEHRLTTEKVYGNRMAYVSLEAPFSEKLEVQVSFDAQRREVSGVSSLHAAGAGDRLRGGDRMAPISDEVRKRAQEAAAGKEDASTVARGLYDRVL